MPTEEPSEPPSTGIVALRRADLLREVRAGREAFRLPLKTPKLLKAPKGDGTAVVMVPGFGATDLSTAPARSFLNNRGWTASGWKQGRNLGAVVESRDRLIERVDRIAQRTGSQVALVGWSLGGVLARETGRSRPDLVRRVVTYGTPVIGGPRYANIGGMYSDDEMRAIDELIAEVNKTPLRIPVTAIYSKLDGVVAWQACIDPDPNTEMVEVRSSHVGMGVDPDVWSIIADRLAR